MRLLTKAEACREFGVSLSTLDRRIASGQLKTRNEPHGQRHRVYIVIDDHTARNTNGDSSLAAVRGRIRGLEEQLRLERRREAELLRDLEVGRINPSGEERNRPWWKFWEKG